MSFEEVVGKAAKDVDSVLLFSSEELDNIEAITVCKGGDLELPVEFGSFEEKIKFGIEGVLEENLIEEGEYLLCVDGVFSDGMDTISFVEAKGFNSGLYRLFMRSKAEASVIRDVVNLLSELGRKGQEGEPTGALFVVGDAGRVMENSRPLAYNPFERSHVHVGDPIVKEMLKEFSRLDGAFVVSDSGKIVSAYRYLEGNSEGIEIPKGLGARHVSGASITKETNSVAVVLSESDSMVRIFKGGKLILELDPEEHG